MKDKIMFGILQSLNQPLLSVQQLTFFQKKASIYLAEALRLEHLDRLQEAQKFISRELYQWTQKGIPPCKITEEMYFLRGKFLMVLMDDNLRAISCFIQTIGIRSDRELDLPKKVVNLLLYNANFFVLGHYFSNFQHIYPNSITFLPLYLLGQMPEEVRKGYEKIQQIMIMYPQSKDDIYYYYLAQGIQSYYEIDFEKSFHYFSQEYDLDQTNLTVIKWLASAAFRLQNYQASLTYLQILLSNLKQGGAKIKILIAANYIKLNEKQRAHKIITSLKSTQRYHFRDRINLVAVYYRLELYKLALDKIFQIPSPNPVELQGFQAQYYVILVMIYEKLGDHKSALKTFRILAANMSQNVHLYLSHFYFQQFYFIIDYAYKNKEFAHGKAYAEAIWAIIDEAKDYSVQVGQRLQKQLRKRMFYDLELWLFE